MKENKSSKTIAIISTISASVLLLGAFTASAFMGGTVTNEGNEVPEQEPKLISLEELQAEISDEKTYIFDTTDIHRQGAKISAAFDEEKHPAVDYILERDTVITSPIDGIIKTAEYDYEKGNHVEIEGLDGTTCIIFAHLEKMYVNKGNKVNAGSEIGTVGTTGYSTGPHLHVEYREDGEAQNPVEVFIVEESGEIKAVLSKPKLIPTGEK